MFTVLYNDKSYNVCVTELEPEDVVNIVETDLEVDIDYSLEYKAHMEK